LALWLVVRLAGELVSGRGEIPYRVILLLLAVPGLPTRRLWRWLDAHTDAGAGMPFGAALADDDVARNHSFAAELLDAKASASGVTTVAG
jgi:hypothetical protein